MTRILIGALAAALTGTMAATPIGSGPPWISIEHPVNPYDSTTRDAFLLVHAFHHGDPTNFPVSGTAEGLVNGQRRSLPLRFSRTTRTGAFALTKQWPATGTWTLVISVSQGPEDRVSAVVELSPAGEVASVTVPTRKEGRHTLPAPVQLSEVEAGLRARSR